MILNFSCILHYIFPTIKGRFHYAIICHTIIGNFPLSQYPSWSCEEFFFLDVDNWGHNGQLRNGLGRRLTLRYETNSTATFTTTAGTTFMMNVMSSSWGCEVVVSSIVLGVAKNYNGWFRWRCFIGVGIILVIYYLTSSSSSFAAILVEKVPILAHLWIIIEVDLDLMVYVKCSNVLIFVKLCLSNAEYVYYFLTGLLLFYLDSHLQEVFSSPRWCSTLKLALIVGTGLVDSYPKKDQK